MFLFLCSIGVSHLSAQSPSAASSLGVAAPLPPVLTVDAPSDDVRVAALEAKSASFSATACDSGCAASGCDCTSAPSCGSDPSCGAAPSCDSAPGCDASCGCESSGGCTNMGGCKCCTTKDKKAAMKKAAGAYKGVFYANDYSYLNDPCYDGCLLGDSLKRLSLGDCWTLDLGGQYRLRYHLSLIHI